MKTITQLFIFLITFFSLNAQIIPLNSLQKIKNTNIVIEGEIISKKSFETENTIYTDYSINIKKLVKGTINTKTITLRSIGGIVGDKMLKTQPSNNLNTGDYAIYFLKKEPNQFYYEVAYFGQSEIILDNPLTVNQVKELQQGNVSVLTTSSIKSVTSTITNINPTIANAGTGETITITGTGFGATGPTSSMKVWTKYSNNPSSYISHANAYNYISWSDTEIVFRLRTQVGTGKIRVGSGSSYSESTQTLQVNYNVKDNPTPLNGNIYPVNLPALQGQGITFTPNVNFTNIDAINRTQEALEQWTCESNIDWSLDTFTSTTNTNNTNDGLSVIYFEPLGGSTLGVTLTSLGACSGNGRWYVKDVDLKLNSSTNFNFSLNPSNSGQIDFYSVVLHELGHVRNLGHVLDPSDIMYPSISTGADKRILHQNDIDGGLWVQSDSNTNSVCSKPLMVDGTCTIVVQTTTIPDPNFENYLETHNANGNVVAIGDPTSMGNGIANDTYVTTANIENVTNLYISNRNIGDLTGIEDFTSLEFFDCSINSITNVDFSQNLQILQIDISSNLLTSLDLSNNLDLEELLCYGNSISTLDLSVNSNFEFLECYSNNLTLLNVKNGNNINFTGFDAGINPNLICIEVDDPTYSTTNWTNIDATSSFSLHCPLGETYVPDNNFETYLETHNSNGTIVAVGDPTSMGNGIANDDYVTTANINTVTNLEVSYLSIADLTGIEDFTALTVLNCHHNNLTVLNVAQNTALTELACNINQITSLDVTQNTGLTKLYCYNNQLTNLNVTLNTALTDFRCYNNLLTNLDVVTNVNLLTFECGYNQLTSLNVKNGNNTNIIGFNAVNNPNLTCIEVDDQNYSTINWNNIDSQTHFNNNCTNPETYVPDDNFENYLETHNASGAIVAIGYPTSMGNGIANDDYVTTASINTVTNLYVYSRNIADMTGIEDFVNLNDLNCYNNQLTSLDVSLNTALTTFSCRQNQITSLNVTGLPNLQSLACDNNQLSNLDLTGLSSLLVFYCEDNQLLNLNLTGLPNLQDLRCADNQLISLDATTLFSLQDLRCNNNQLTNLNITGLSNLQNLDCNHNQLAGLNLTGLNNLTVFSCGFNQLLSLDLTGVLGLQYLYCYYNQLTSLNIQNGNNTNIVTFKTTNNPNLTCIEVDNPTYSTANWSNIDPASTFSNNCPNLCSYPSNQTATIITAVGATLDWQENSTATTWDLEIGLQGFTPTGNPTNNDINKPYIWSNGLDNTNYDYYVRADCNADNINTSSWTGPFSFSTLSKTVCENGFELVNGTPFTAISQGSIAFADIDGDNDQDVLISGIDSSNQLITELYVNDGLGNFTLVVSTPFTAVAYGSITFADIDNDNDQDVLITGIISTTTYQPITELYTNDGLGNFTLVNTTPFDDLRYSSAAFIDIDNDNDLDVLISGQTQANQRISKIYTNNGSGVFTFNTNLNGLSHSYIIIGDIDNDNDSDIFITGTNGGQTQNYLYKNDSLGNFTASPTVIMPVFNGKAIFADIDNDNDLDLFVSGSNVIYSNTINFYLNDGLGNYTLTPTAPFDGFNPANGGIYADSFEILDIDNDNDMDVALVNNNLKQLYENDGLGNYTLLVETPFVNTVGGSSMVSVDMDNDNDQDILITGLTPASTPTSNLYKNNINYDTKYTVTGWTNGVPTLSKCVVIDQDYTTTSFSAYKTTVNTNKTLTIAANTYMQVQKSIENNGVITIEPTGSVVQIEGAATVIGTGIFNTKIVTTPLQDATRFTYFSSPSATETLNTFASWGDLNYLWNFNETTQDWDYITNTSTAMQAGNGYIVRGNASNTYPNFIGLTTFQNGYNNGVITQNLHFKGDASATANLDNDNNLVGNPYPSAINGTKLLNVTLNPTAGTLYFWTHNSGLVNGDFSTDDYAMWNLSGGTAAISGGTAPTGYIASGQGFFIDAEGDETLPLGQEVISTLTFNNEMRETSNNTDFRTPNNTEFDKIWLNLSNNQGVFNQTLLSFSPNATTAYDNAYDGKRSTNGVATLYSIGLNNQHFGIQALPLLQGNTIIPLGYQIENETITNLEISIDHFENLQDVTVYLRDNLLHAVHNLSQSAYQFSILESGIFNTRFELLFRNSALGENDITLNENLIVSNLNENTILIKTTNSSIISKVEVFDVLGKLIYNDKPQKSIILLPTQNINNGTVLFTKVILENGQILTKKIIKIE